MECPGNEKKTLIFSTQEEVGALANALKIFKVIIMSLLLAHLFSILKTAQHSMFYIKNQNFDSKQNLCQIYG